MKLRFPIRPRQRGFALLLVLITVMVLSLIVAGLWESSQPGWEESALNQAREQAGLLADSGINVAMHPSAAAGDLALRQTLAPERSFVAVITTEEGRFPINRLGEERLRASLLELFILWGLDAASANTASDSLSDWIDADSDPLPNGAEDGYYAGLEHPEFPPNVNFTSLDQLPFVAGMDRVAQVQPFYRDFFTLYSDGKIDLNAAPAQLIQAFTGATPDAALNLVSVRNGGDGIVGTIDDYRFEDSGEVQTLLGLDDAAWAEISTYATLAGTVKRIESTGTVGNFSETRILLARETTSGGQTTRTPIAKFRK
jgi:general secretion pathway protein K